MKFHPDKVVASAAIFLLAACGGGGEGQVVPPVVNEENGLSYGAEGQSLQDAEETEVSMDAASFQAGGSATIARSTILLDANFFAGETSDLDGTINIFGQEVTITNGAGTLPTGENVVLTFESVRAGTYAAALEATISSIGKINGEAAYVFGFETNPDVIAARVTGGLIYAGDFQAFGSVNGVANTQTEYEGGITVTVDFSGSGNADVVLEGTLNGSASADLTGNGIEISGNSFTGNLACTAGCSGSGSSTIDATFYGPDADELGGVIGVGIAVGGETFDGVGTFVLTNPTAN